MPAASGFIGLGNIGAPMAHRVAEGTQTIVFDVRAGARSAFEGKAQVAQSPAEIGKEADVVGLCVRDDADVTAVTAGSDGLFETMGKGGIILVHSTVSPATIHRLAAQAAAKGIDLVDAAVTGGPGRAAAGTLVTMIGATPEAFAKARPFAAHFSSEVIHAGELGAGIAAKICNNIVGYMSVLAVYESFGVAEAAGVSPDVLRKIMSGNGNLTEMMGLYLAGREAVRSGGVPATGTQHAASLARKDLALGIELGEANGRDARVSRAIRELIDLAF
ncbi:NAD(P)-dependent oxidoreductase [Rhizorhabdus argentea]|uniref:NAD(P)-dependent oxidoreductase n=1 Tax=Rhizorhabdus argentea TaxID=1387174 RepID=UPI0030ED253A